MKIENIFYNFCLHTRFEIKKLTRQKKNANSSSEAMITRLKHY